MSNQEFFGKTVARVIAKKEVQKMLQALRDAGVDVEKLNAGYEARVPEGEHKGKLLFKAMNGQRGYLCRITQGLFS